MNVNKKITGSDLFQMVPGLKEAMTKALEECGIPHENELNENTTVNMSPYKEAIQNAETPKQKSAKNKISDLTRK